MQLLLWRNTEKKVQELNWKEKKNKCILMCETLLKKTTHFKVILDCSEWKGDYFV
jgi:hypothetical protein